MRRIAVFIMVVVAVASAISAQDVDRVNKSMTRTQIINKLASNPSVSVTYLTKSMLSRLPNNRSGSPLSMLVGNEAITSVRVYELGNAEAETYGRKLMDAYIDGSPLSELLLLQRDGEKDNVIIYGIPMTFHRNQFEYVLIYTKQKGKTASLIILSGKMTEEMLGDLIDAFSTVGE